MNRGTGTSVSGTKRMAADGLAVLGAALLVGSAVIHLELWTGSYGPIPTVGPLFLFQGIAGLVLAVALAVLRKAGLMLAGAVFLVATAGGLLLSHWFGLFGYRENLAVPYAGMSLVIEPGGAVVLLAALSLTIGRRRQGVGGRRPVGGRR